ncbi:WD-40 repeat-containing protein [Thamnocephalis sphaerospora]|uniref:WD-40 repeat-containing protein n=1 Tax=Thamnocephalis sphaerospora TaxID=78915 RepID=A0A4P9XN75_9FUNG|nr:WD-40 repeat-containing protein [Thamnocephalis sphaerospora]|eukprot:RKP06861.1 WD-40 repeat-containing protein [Thamnocephalis sphaerospora]
MTSSSKSSLPQFQLSATLAGHEDDVRALAADGSDVVYSASRDHTVRSWRRSAKGKDVDEFKEGDVYTGHSSFVNAIAFIPANDENPDGLIVSGGSDKVIKVHEPGKHGSPVFTLAGHTNNVCALHVSALGVIVSGSWDMTARVWENWRCVRTLEGHAQAVWAVLVLQDATVVTGSADKTLRRWRDGQCVSVMQGHEDCVRGLAEVPGVGFLSCSNDSTLRLWTLDGTCVREMSAHTSFVYSVAVLPTGEFLSSGEDRTVRVWRDGQCVQTITHPCISVWAVAALENGDFASGGSDKVVRIFSRDPARIASEENIKEYEELVAAQAIPANQVGDVNKDKLPGLEALNKPGNKDGQVIMVRSGNIVEAHQWNAADGQWSKIGEVVDAVGNSRKKQFDGKEYDFLFDVDIGDGIPPLKLPYNANENPYTAAQRFLDANDIPQGYLDQVAQFIEKNAGGAQVQNNAPSNYVDPFTGMSYRYGNFCTQASAANTAAHVITRRSTLCSRRCSGMFVCSAGMAV